MSFEGHWVGLDEAIRSLEAKDRNLPILKRAKTSEIGRFMVNELKRNAHRWEKRKKGTHMADSIDMRPAGDDVIVAVHKDYAVYENAREGEKPGHGPHNFGDRSEDTTRQIYNTKIRVSYEDFFNSK